MFGKKKQLRKAIKEEVELIKEVQAMLEEEAVPVSKREAVAKKWRHLTEHLNKIAPREKLTRKQLLVRAGVATILIFLIAASVSVYVKFTYFSETITRSEGKVGEAQTRRFIPEEIAQVAPVPWVMGTITSQEVDLARFDELSGTVVAVIPVGNSIEVYYTRRDGGSFSLYRRLADRDLQEISVEEKVFAPGDLVDISLALENEQYVAAYTIRVNQKEQLFIQMFDFDWKEQTTPIALPLVSEQETGVGLGLVRAPVSDISAEEMPAYYLATSNFYGVNASVNYKTAPIVRALNASFSLLQVKVLETDKVSLDTHLALLPREGGGLWVVGNGKDPLAPTEQKKGDELYLLEYDKQWGLVQMFRLTNNGLPHDFWPSEVFMDRGLLFIPYHQIQQLPQYEGHDTGYPQDAGKVFVLAVKDGKLIVGTLFVADYGVRLPGGERKLGGRDAHFARMENRLFVAYDAIVEEDALDPGDGDYRIVRIKWLDLVY